MQDKLLSTENGWFQSDKIREKLKANCTPSLKKNEASKRPGPLIAKHKSEIQLARGFNSDVVLDGALCSNRTPSPCNSTEPTFLNKSAGKRPVSPTIRQSRRPLSPTPGPSRRQVSPSPGPSRRALSPVVGQLPRSRSPARSRSPTSPLLRRSSPLSGSQDNLQIEAIRKRVKKAQKARLYLLQRPGPNSLVVGGDLPEHKYKVIIGPQTCSCGHGPHCVHILFVMLRVFQVQENDQQLFVKELKNFEVESLFLSYDEKRKKRISPQNSISADSLRASSESILNENFGITAESRSSSMNELRNSNKDEDHPCPICLLEMSDGESLATCWKGCKNQLHHHCVAVWSLECRSQNEPVLCPLCRAEWCWSNNANCPQVVDTEDFFDGQTMAQEQSNPEEPSPNLPTVIITQNSSSSSSSSHSSTVTVSTVRNHPVSSSRTSLNSRDTYLVPIEKLEEWKEAMVFGSNFIDDLVRRDWSVREAALERLCSAVGHMLTIYSAHVHDIIPVFCDILSIMAMDPVYKVYIRCLKCLRVLLARTPCFSSEDVTRLQTVISPIVHSMIMKCADGNRRTSQISVSSLTELCLGQSGELAVGKETDFRATENCFGVSFLLEHILETPNGEPEVKWQWYLGRLKILDQLIEDYPHQFYLLYVETMPGYSGRFDSRLDNYERIMSVLKFSLKLINYPHTTVSKLARRVYELSARSTSHIPAVCDMVCDSVKLVDPVFYRRLKQRLCMHVQNMNEFSKSRLPSSSISFDRVVYTSVISTPTVNGGRRMFGSCPAVLPDRRLIVEMLSNGSVSERESNTKRNSRPNFRHSISHDPIPERSRSLNMNYFNPERMRTDNSLEKKRLQRPKHLPLPNIASHDVSLPSSALNSAQQYHHHLRESIQHQSFSSTMCRSSSHCPVGDLIDLTVPTNPEIATSTLSPVSFREEVLTPSTPSVMDVSEYDVSANYLARHVTGFEDEGVTKLIVSLRQLRARSTLPSIPGLTNSFENLVANMSSNGNESVGSPDNNTYEEGKHWIRGHLLGSGAFSYCYQARDLQTGALMAVKQISFYRPTPEEQEARMANIFDEIVLMKRLDHPNIVRLLGATQQGYHYNMFVEWMPGGCVADLLKEYGGFSDTVIRRYIHQTLGGLSYLHANQVFHRDLKGANLLVDTTGYHLSIADFGAAARLASQRTIADEFKGQLLGTIAFMAPEVLRGEEYGRSSDVWSLGCVIIEMATAKPPWDDANLSNDLALLYRIASSKKPPSIPEYLTPDIHDLAVRCLERDPEKRPSAKDLLQHQCFANIEA